MCMCRGEGELRIKKTMIVETTSHWAPTELGQMCGTTHSHEPEGSKGDNDNEHGFMEEARDTMNEEADWAIGMVNMTRVESVEEHSWWNTETNNEKKDNGQEYSKNPAIGVRPKR